MPPPRFLTDPEKHTINLEKQLFLDANKRASETGCNSFSDYIRRLLDADLRRKRSLSRVGSRTYRSRRIQTAA